MVYFPWLCSITTGYQILTSNLHGMSWASSLDVRWRGHGDATDWSGTQGRWQVEGTSAYDKKGTMGNPCYLDSASTLFFHIFEGCYICQIINRTFLSLNLKMPVERQDFRKLRTGLFTQKAAARCSAKTLWSCEHVESSRGMQRLKFTGFLCKSNLILSLISISSPPFCCSWWLVQSHLPLINYSLCHLRPRLVKSLSLLLFKKHVKSWFL